MAEDQNSVISRKTALAVIALALVLSGFLKTYYVRSDAGGELFWSANEAYVFEGIAERGYPMTYWGVLIEVFREMFPFGASSPRDDHFYVVVLRVTPASVQRYTVDNFWLGSMEPFERSFYAGNLLAGGTLMKWSGTQFDRATPEELKRYYANVSHLPPGTSFDNVAGWSKRTVGGDVIRKSPTDYVENDAKVTIELGGKPFSFVMNSGFISHEAYIDLLRPMQPPERIWHLNEQSHRVSKSDYLATFTHPR